MRCLTCALLGVAIVAAIGCGSNDPAPSENPAAKTPRQSAANSTQPVRQQFGEFSFEVPGGWSNVAPDRATNKAMVLFEGTNWQNAKGMIKVDVGTPTLPTAQETAAKFASDFGGSVAPGTAHLAGENGVKVTTPSKTMNAPRVILVVYRGGKTYLVMGAAADNVDVAGAIEHIRSTWKWES